ncbi:DUF6011 domain-containing protein [Nocardia fluminea]|uniref:DUF6011 domain-containing protein n=1 Tax=Nocardia fluminea TaxID=134984 RepID=UPI003661FA55
MTEPEDHAEVRLVAHCRRCHGWLLSTKSVAAGIGRPARRESVPTSRRRPR